MTRVLLPDRLDTIHDLRLAAANLKVDMLLLYSLDTRFNIDSTNIDPLSMISPGFLPDKRARITTTASAVLVDVRTGFVYGVAESTIWREQNAAAWSSRSAIGNARQKTEVASFQSLLGEIENLWHIVVATHNRP
jgi:hypothetical protein